MSLLGVLKRKGETGFGFQSTSDEVLEGLELEGKTILVTGCASGLGLETLRALSRHKARIIALARSAPDVERACSDAPRAIPVVCDLSEPDSVRRTIEAVSRLQLKLDAIVANAGVMAPARVQRKHGCELQFLVNHVGHHLLVTRLLGLLAIEGRVVVVSSSAHTRAPAEGIRFDDIACSRWYDAWEAYGQSKLANILFAKELARRLGARQTANALHPGIVRTHLQRHLSPVLQAMYPALGALLFKSIQQGAATQCFLAAHPRAASANGEYFVDCNVATPSRAAHDAALGARLWSTTEELLSRVQG